MNFFFKYFRRNLKYILAFAVIIACFTVVLYLHDAPLDAVKYATVLSSTLLIILASIDFAKMYRKQKDLEALKNEIEYSIEHLPKPVDYIEEDYQELLRTVFDSRSQLKRSAAADRKEIIDYYTMWAHQIKTPIAAMRLLLQSRNLDEDKELLNELFKIEQYVQMVLGYLRLGSDYTDFLIRHCNLDSIARASIRKFAGQFIKKRLSFNYTPADFEVLTDDKWLSFVIEQLLSNAIKYTNTGSVSVYGDENSKSLIIEDTGIGIDASDLPRVFDNGFTGYNGRENRKSTGIGLYLCRSILRKLGHTISIESEVGKGSKVTVCLAEADIKHE